MSNITEWIKNELYPSLFESMDRALPEMNFKRLSGGWRSSLKLYGEKATHNRPDKTVVTNKAPGMILEQGGEVLSLVDYVMNRDNGEFIEAVKTLASVAGLQLPPMDNQEEYQRYKEKATILENCNSYFTYCLDHSLGAQEVKGYLQDRGYSPEDIKTMELGYIPSQAKLFEYLKKQGYSQELINEAIQLNGYIGNTHKLTIPFRSGGSLKGFSFRTTGAHDPKYLNSTGLKRGESFFNISALKGDKDLIIVEGYLDALIAEAKGVSNVVALGQNKVTADQVKDAIKRGAKKFTLCLDPDKAGKEGIDQTIEAILQEGEDRIYIAMLPEVEGKKIDPDTLIKESGVETFKEVLREAEPYYYHQLQGVINSYSGRDLTAKEEHDFIDEVVETASRIINPIDRDRFKEEFISYSNDTGLGITQGSLSIAVDRITSRKDKEDQERALDKTLSEVKDLRGKGKTKEALDLLGGRLNSIRLEDKKASFEDLLKPTTEEELIEGLKNAPGDLKTGYTIKGDELLLPGGAITVYAGATGHGKTVLSINTALNVAREYPEKRFIFFTYEESDKNILQYFINTYVNIELSEPGTYRSNRRLIKQYFKTGSTNGFNIVARDNFITKKEKFFREYITTGRILVKYVNYNANELGDAIRYLHKTEPNLGGVFIDYFQLLNLSPEDARGRSRQQELKDICINLKDVAVDTGLPICLAAQFNREVTSLKKLHPTKIGEAGDIERIVNTLVGLWDISKKSTDTTPGEDNEIKKITGDRQTGLYIELLKSRDLPAGTWELLDYKGNTGNVEMFNSFRDEGETDIFR